MSRSQSALAASVAAALLASVGLAGHARAKISQSYPVFIDAAAHYAQGSLGSVRATGDLTQQISCWTSTSGTGLNPDGTSTDEPPPMMVGCFAVDATGYSASCSFSGDFFPSLLFGAESAFYYFEWDDVGNCTRIDVGNWSVLEPKVR